MKILIVDRVKVFQQLIAGALDGTGIEQSFAVSAEEAIELASAGKYDCICTALYLDDMDGFEFCKKMRAHPDYRHTPIVLLTAESDKGLLQKALNAGITDIFSKKHVRELVDFIERFTEVNKPLSGRVLYVEDQKSQRVVVTRMFESRGLVVDAFDNAEDAWQSFLQNHYHVVLTDIVLVGEAGGVMLINKIRRLEGVKGDTPILAITAFDVNSRRISLYHMGITDYVTKPVIEEELIARVRNQIANKKALEREIQFREHLNSEEMIRRSQKMEAMVKLTSGIAHDYNNMLAIVLGYTDLLKHRFKDDDSVLKYVEQIEKASKNGTKLTGKLLAFSRKDAAVKEIININQVVEDIAPMLENVLTAGIRFTRNLADNLWNVLADPNDLENALMNLCINAKHAMGDKGSLTIVTANRHLKGEHADRLGLVEADYVRLSVLDSGEGIPRDVVSKIFDPFFTTKGRSGTGLGLSQVYGFVQRSKGGIEVESRPGQGTLFSLYFPRDAGDVVKPELKGHEQSAVHGKKHKRVLVVDDEESLAELNREVLKNEGYISVAVYDAASAIKAMEEEPFDALLTDIVMPGMNGYELAATVRQRWPATKIISTSGYDKALDASKEMRKNIDCHLDKPVSRTELIESLERLFSQKGSRKVKEISTIREDSVN